jgi:hypothetical protein
LPFSLKQERTAASGGAPMGSGRRLDRLEPSSCPCLAPFLGSNSADYFYGAARDSALTEIKPEDGLMRDHIAYDGI